MSWRRHRAGSRNYCVLYCENVLTGEENSLHVVDGRSAKMHKFSHYIGMRLTLNGSGSQKHMAVHVT